MCSLSGMMRVSCCKWCRGVVFVHPVAILRAVFSVIWSLLICVSAMSVCHAGCAYVMTGLIPLFCPEGGTCRIL